MKKVNNTFKIKKIISFTEEEFSSSVKAFIEKTLKNQKDYPEALTFSKKSYATKKIKEKFYFFNMKKPLLALPF